MAERVKVAVIGAGNLGPMISADLVSRGFEVTLADLPEYEANIQPIVDSGNKVELIGALSGTVKINFVTTDLEEAFERGKLIICPVRQVLHERLAKLFIPYLRDGQTILLWPGCAGTLIFARILKEEGVRKDLLLAELEQSPIAGRRVGSNKFRVDYYSKRIAAAAFPAKNNEKLKVILEGLGYEVTLRKHVLETALNFSNIIAHPILLLLNLGAVEQLGEDYDLDPGGRTESVNRLWLALDKEKLALCRALGLPERPRPSGVGMYKPGEKKRGPKPMWKRYRKEFYSRFSSYFTEDVPNLVLFASLGDMLGVETPIAKAIILLASIINETDYYEVGRTVERLGIAGMTKEQLDRYLMEGKL